MGQEKDKTFKLISYEFLIELLKILEIDIDLDIDDMEIEILTQEQILIEPSLFRPDFIAKIGNVILMLEFQSSVVKRYDKKRFKVYISNFDLKINTDDNKIKFFVISTAEHSKIAAHCINDIDCFNFPIISLLDYDEKEIISNIKEK